MSLLPSAQSQPAWYGSTALSRHSGALNTECWLLKVECEHRHRQMPLMNTSCTEKDHNMISKVLLVYTLRMYYIALLWLLENIPAIMTLWCSLSSVCRVILFSKLFLTKVKLIYSWIPYMNYLLSGVWFNLSISPWSRLCDHGIDINLIRTFEQDPTIHLRFIAKTINCILWPWP